MLKLTVGDSVLLVFEVGSVMVGDFDSVELGESQVKSNQIKA
jgi:hypothetical protein